MVTRRTTLSLVAALILSIGCSDQPDSTHPTSHRPDLPQYPDKAALPPTYCSSSACIEEFLADVPCGGGGSSADLYPSMAGGPYGLAGYYDFTGCRFGSLPANWWSIIGESSVERPTLEVTDGALYEAGVLHASIRFGHGLLDKPNLIQDMKLQNQVKMRNGQGPGLQLEYNSLDIVNSEFSGPGTTHFLNPRQLDFNGLTLASDHEFIIGRPDWCDPGGGEFCAGNAPYPPGDGSKITNSTLAGRFELDVLYIRPQQRRIIFQDNDLIANLVLDAELIGTTTRPVAELTGNTFSSEAGPKVTIKGDYVVVASGNETFQGPCLQDALLDFDTSEVSAGNANPLTLDSYVYAGETYCPDEQEILSKEIYFLGGSCTTVYVKFVTNGIHASGSVNWGVNGCTNSVPTRVIGDTHYASFDVGNVRAFYWQAESSFCENTDSTNCKKEYRPRFGVYGCPEPVGWPF